MLDSEESCLVKERGGVKDEAEVAVGQSDMASTESRESEGLCYSDNS